MDVRLSPEQKALRDSVSRVVGELGPRVVSDLADTARRAKLDAAVGSSGWREMRHADDAGGPLASSVDIAIVVEEAGRGVADVPLTGPLLAAELRRLAGADPADGPETVVLTGDFADPAILDGATPTGGGPDGPVAVDATGIRSALALTSTGGLMFVGLGPARERPDLTRGLAPVEGAPAPLEHAHPLDGDGLDRWRALGLALTCADIVGTMEGVTRLATEYATMRRQYGVAVGSFQAVQHMLADALVAVEGSRSLALHAAWAADALPPAEALAAGYLAKAYCARAARTVCETAIQVHGGIGNTWDCMAHVHLRRALLSADLLGGVGACLEHVLAHHGLEARDAVR